MTTDHTRQAPNGSQVKVEIPGRTAESLKYGEQITVLINGKQTKAVVDVIVAAAWGGSEAALRHWISSGTAHPHAMMKIVWEYEPGAWNESRDVYPASFENFQTWIRAFNGRIPPTPMP